MVDTIVLGAGMVGVATALALQARGDAVALIDRKGIGRETSFGNAGAIQTEAVEPYPFPRDPAMLAAIALRRSNAVHWHFHHLGRIARPLFDYWRNSAPVAYGRAAGVYQQIIAQADRHHAPLIEASGASGLIDRKGYTTIYRTEAAMGAALREAERVREHRGVGFEALDAAAIAAAEPALKIGLAGAIRYADVWTCRSPGGLTAAYGRLFAERGGIFRYGDAQSLRQSGSGWSVRTEEGTLEAARVVIALGPWSATLLERFGYRIPLFTKRGYHRHFAMEGGPSGPLFDVESATFMSPMDQGLRLTTGAEFTTQDARVDWRQIRASERAVRELFDIGPPVEDVPWFGHRPCLPDMLPVIGAAPDHPGMWFHFGHSHQGFTAGPATAQILADLMAGQTSTTGDALGPRRFATMGR